MIKCIFSSYYYGVIVSGIKKQKNQKIIRGTENVVLGDKRPGVCDEEKVQDSPIRRGGDLHPPNREL